MNETTKKRIYRLLSDAVDALPTNDELADCSGADNIDELAYQIEKAIDALAKC